MRIVVVLIFILVIFSCHKESFTSSPDAFLKLNVDTLHFDTIFTSAGSTTQVVKIINDNNKGIHVSSVELKGGAASPFKINVNGQSGTSINNVDIAEEDSAYVFVTVKIDPTTANLPFLIRDSIEISYNGNKATVQLDAFGRNAHFFRSRILTANETWNNDLPYVILGGLEVKENTTLTINEGCQVYLHADAPLLVKGTLQVLGKKYDSTRVVFTGDRMDEPYRGFPASWPGIYFLDASTNNSIEYAVIKNAYQAVVVQSTTSAANTKLQLSQTIIDNAYETGLIGVNATIAARNVLISNCGRNLVLVNGGDYEFTHCTVATIASSYIQHNNPVLLLSNYLEQNSPSINLKALFRNCIFWGEGGLVKDEASVLRKAGNTLFNVQFDHVLWKVEKNPADVTMNSVTNNQSPLFELTDVTKRQYSFRVQAGSPAINSGIDAGVLLDLDGATRPVDLPDLGCYEKQ